ncbi:MAG: DUF167 domain-containing protein [Deltaproteobacteria bacterium]|nr:DUF167 domain-containing protein [Deltaproteobacteria bacterium]
MRVLVSPRASRAAVGPVVGDRIKLSVKAPPVDGKANQAVVALIAEALGVPKAQVSVVAGTTGKRKSLRIEGVGTAALLRLIGR